MLLLLSSEGIRICSEENYCPPNWKGFNGDCYNFLSDLHMNWQHARDYCRHRGSKLVEIESALEDKFIIQNVVAFNFTNNCFWLGGSNDEGRRNWSWVTSQKPFEYTNWGPGEPNHYLPNENCLNLLNDPLYHYVYYWNDQYCTRSCHLICEQPGNIEGSLVG
ncbi:hepatic lectin-like isoform X2 [Saccostrea cucullata]|uniref:hepatic lectin-like isoform X2 n=1 Tax=Saccostrea cuccullata TaxID=36930 RepID=UPI002ED1FF56